jgi:hypothetical protein
MKSSFLSVSGAIVIFLIVAFALAGYSFRLFPEYSITLKLFFTFFLLLGVFHLIAWLRRKKGFSKDFLHLMEYVYLALSAVALFGVLGFEFEFSQKRAENLNPYLDSALSTIRSQVEWGKNYYCMWENDLIVDGFKAGYLCEWYKEASRFFAESYSQQAWDRFLQDNKSHFSGKSTWHISFLLSEMDKYSETYKKRKALLSSSLQDWDKILRFVGFYAIALALCLRITKLTIEARRWVSLS